MRTTIRLDDALLAEAKEIAARTDRTLGEVIEDAVRESLARRRRAVGRSATVALPVFGQGGLRPGVDLDDGDALLDLMDGPGP